MSEPVEDAALGLEGQLEVEFVVASNRGSVKHLGLERLGRDDDHAEGLPDEVGLVEAVAGVVAVHEMQAVGKGLGLDLEFDALVAQPADEVGPVLIISLLEKRMLGTHQRHWVFRAGEGRFCERLCLYFHLVFLGALPVACLWVLDVLGAG